MEDSTPVNDVSNEPTAPETDSVTLRITHHGITHNFSFPSSATLSDLSLEIALSLRVPQSNQKLMVSNLGLLKPPFKDPTIPLSTLTTHKISLLGSTTSEISSISAAATQASQAPAPRPRQTVKAYKTHDWKKEQEEAQYTFTTLQPLPYLPNPQRSLDFLQRLKDDAGIKASMRKHKFTVPLLTEMNPIEHTQSNHEGTSRTLGLNRNKGEVIELRLRTDAYDGYRDYKTIRNTLCHELAHNVWGDHDRNFWDLCKQIEKEVAASDWRTGGKSVGERGEYYGEEDDEADHGSWSGGDFVVGGGAGEGMSRREVLARAAEERIKREKEANGSNGNNGNTN
jgi:hypothetical protein